MPIWEVLTQYYRGAYLGYWNCYRAFGASATVPKRDPTQPVIIAARALAAVARHVLLLKMRYLLAPKETWAHLWSLIGRSDEWGIAAEPVTLYPDGSQTTVERELLMALLLEVAPTGNLLPGQMVALERLLRPHAQELLRSPRYDPRATPFVYDPSRSAPPERWFSRLEVRAELRYFGLGGAYDALCQARAASGRPHWLGETRCSTEGYDKLVERIVAILWRMTKG
jgi:hypothetical protein